MDMGRWDLSRIFLLGVWNRDGRIQLRTHNNWGGELGQHNFLSG